MENIPKLLLKLSRQLFEDSAQQTQFVEALVHPQPFSPCILWCQPRPPEGEFEVLPPVSWQPDFVDRLKVGEKPGRHPRHAAGEYYCLDFSSVFAASVLGAIAPFPAGSLNSQAPRLVIDVCASPGGKSIFAWRALNPQKILCNEVIGKRIGALSSNLKRCGVTSSTITHLDSDVLAQQFPGAATVVLVDAPCTGQSLLAKGEKNPGCFHPVTINKNANRQKRILANASRTVAPQGYLVYMTCAYSPEENEQVVAWLLARFPQFQPVAVAPLTAYQSHLTPLPCYRMFPQEGLGAGAFTVLLQNQTAAPLS